MLCAGAVALPATAKPGGRAGVQVPDNPTKPNVPGQGSSGAPVPGTPRDAKAFEIGKAARALPNFVDANLTSSQFDIYLSPSPEFARQARALTAMADSRLFPVVVHEVPKSRKTLIAIRDKISADRRNWESRGVHIIRWGIVPTQGKVYVAVANLSAARADMLVAAYGAENISVRPARPGDVIVPMANREADIQPYREGTSSICIRTVS
jgi:hypothetical protein